MEVWTINLIPEDSTGSLISPVPIRCFRVSNRTTPSCTAPTAKTSASSSGPSPAAGSLFSSASVLPSHLRKQQEAESSGSGPSGGALSVTGSTPSNASVREIRDRRSIQIILSELNHQTKGFIKNSWISLRPSEPTRTKNLYSCKTQTQNLDQSGSTRTTEKDGLRGSISSNRLDKQNQKPKQKEQKQRSEMFRTSQQF